MVTPESWLSVEPGSGLGTALHCVPSQCSSTEPLSYPTAHTSSGAAAATPSSVPPALGTPLHCVPSQCFVSPSPTAQTLVADNAVTARRRQLHKSSITVVQRVPSQCKM